MKKTVTHSCFLIYALGALLFLTNNSSASNPTADKAPGTKHPSVSPANPGNAAKIGNPKNQVQNMYDIQFNYPMGFPSGVSCVFTGTEFWVGAWNKDSIYTLDPAGNVTAGFKIAGVGAAGSGVRAFTYDGTTLYASDNTTLIKKIDPAICVAGINGCR